VPLLPLISVKGSPGVTVSAIALGAAWPAGRPPALVVECDPAGGDVAARFGLSLDPGLVSLAVALQREEDVSPALVRDLLRRHSQELRGGLRVVVAPSAPEEMRHPLERLAEDLPRADADVIADCGRLESLSARERTPTLRLIQRAGVCVVVVRPLLDELKHLQSWLPALTALRVRITVLLTHGGRYSAEEVSETLEVEVIGSLPRDPAGAAVLSGGGSALGIGRLPLLRAARQVASALTRQLVAGADGEAAARVAAELPATRVAEASR